ncbi:arginyltransferase [Pyruvatibacter mobilis]|uniref:Aspartate/glutamate leucyltransferase n=1 Tax=Pyruvatibacter mobilis TaxID=1712261 RepID=A0A845QBQ0_9HYPH|nr:arginyltransferase [Pyruvatibacter mobilis]NBG95809.1 arginyltransferase [Pyruvatibacter mobilis]QJD74950.1 arginyltransferase [Pyruvatibacter mobilis]GGD11459.1 putative arginyl-tRNA--protein transferase [Pyruvatibacter mobilis]
MTHHAGKTAPRFYLTAETPCPYLEGKMERKVFTHLLDADADAINSMLTTAGFRRSQTIAYKPACDGCSACVSVRIPVDAFELTTSYRRILRKNRDLVRIPREPMATEPQYELLHKYLNQRHANGGMSDMDDDDFAAMVEETTVSTLMFEYWTKPDPDDDAAEPLGRDRLIATALTDVIDDGLSMVYSFFDPQEHARSLGTYMILDHVAKARELGLPYVYLGYWIEGCRKMSYKARYRPLEALTMEGWMRLPSEKARA